MNATNQVQIFLSMLTAYLPTLLISAVAVVVLLARRSQVGTGAMWGMLGFGLSLALCLVMPVAHTLIQIWVMQSEGHAQRAWVYSIVSIVSSLLHAVVYGLLLVGILAGRAQPNPTLPPPFNRG